MCWTRSGIYEIPQFPKDSLEEGAGGGKGGLHKTRHSPPTPLGGDTFSGALPKAIVAIRSLDRWTSSASDGRGTFSLFCSCDV